MRLPDRNVLDSEKADRGEHLGAGLLQRLHPLRSFSQELNSCPNSCSPNSHRRLEQADRRAHVEQVFLGDIAAETVRGHPVR